MTDRLVFEISEETGNLISRRQLPNESTLSSPGITAPQAIFHLVDWLKDNGIPVAVTIQDTIPHPLATDLPGDNIRAHDAIAKNNG